MTNQEFGQLMERWEVDRAFRAALRCDPETAARNAGFILSGEELAVLASINWRLPVAEICGQGGVGD